MIKNEMTALTYLEMCEAKNRMQKKACLAIMKELGINDKAILNLATGGGKTRVAWKVIFEYFRKLNLVLFMVPKISLVDQTIEEWIEQGIEFEAATVYTSGNVKTINQLRDFATMQTDKVKIVFAVYNSVGLQNDGTQSIITQSGIEFDLAIYDECHRTAGKHIGLFTSCVTDEIVKAKKKLFMTATVKAYDVRDEDDRESANEFSMENKELFGNVAFTLTIAEAIHMGILNPFKTYLLEVSDTRIASMLKDEVRFLNETVKGQLLATAYSVIKAYELGARKIVVMYQKNKHARDFANLFRYMQHELGMLTDATIGCVAGNVKKHELRAPLTCTTDRAAQKWYLKEGPFWNAESAIVTSTPWLKEGEDVPCIDCIVFGDRFQSGIDIIQIIGRALRWYPGKGITRVILPIREGERNKASQLIRAAIGNIENTVNDAQIIRNEWKDTTNETPQVPTESETTESTEANEGNAERWLLPDGSNVFDDSNTSSSTISINQGSVEIEVIHDSTFTHEARIAHDEMLNNLELKLTGNWKRFLTEERAKNFIHERIQMVATPNKKDTAHYYHLDDYYYTLYSSRYNLSLKEAKEELKNFIPAIQKLRENAILSIF